MKETRQKERIMERYIENSVAAPCRAKRAERYRETTPSAASCARRQNQYDLPASLSRARSPLFLIHPPTQSVYTYTHIHTGVYIYTHESRTPFIFLLQPLSLSLTTTSLSWRFFPLTKLTVLIFHFLSLLFITHFFHHTNTLQFFLN